MTVRPEEMFLYCMIKVKYCVETLENTEADDYGHVYDAGSKIVRSFELVPREQILQNKTKVQVFSMALKATEETTQGEKL